ncbi:hypothetical protein O181_005063 [Austropuccinia psidii MF-1]|uniref:Chromo domain-containing protein n=1 Tax=Austropuccinia psidii MF-1 TaxID=1389203 RepID=A0A9Q3BHK0_9BASI|nr:hypothetical protein [Austropuccinia psidii MF-1]
MNTSTLVIYARRQTENMGRDMENIVELRLTEEFSRKHPVFPVSLVNPYFQTGEDRFPSRNKTYTPQDIVEVEDSHGPVKKSIKATKIRLNSKDQRQYLVIFKDQTADNDEWLPEEAISDGSLHLRIFRASRRSEQSHHDEPFLEKGYVSLCLKTRTQATGKYDKPMVEQNTTKKWN